MNTSLSSQQGLELYCIKNTLKLHYKKTITLENQTFLQLNFNFYDIELQNSFIPFKKLVKYFRQTYIIIIYNLSYFNLPNIFIV